MIGKGHPDILRVAARVASEAVGIPEDSSAGMTVGLLEHPGVWIGVVAQRPLLIPAKLTVPTANHGDDYHALSRMQLFDIRACFNHLAHKFVTNNVTLLHGGNVAV